MSLNAYKKTKLAEYFRIVANMEKVLNGVNNVPGISALANVRDPTTKCLVLLFYIVLFILLLCILRIIVRFH